MAIPRFTANDILGPSLDDMAAAFDRDGVLVVEDFVASAAGRALAKRIDDLVDTFDPTSVRTVFSTDDQSHAADRYFRESGDKIRFFLEAGAFEDGKLTKPKDRVLNKIGHAMHDLDPVFDRFSRDERLATLAERLGLTDPGLVQSMVIFKQPYIGGEVDLHQDATFLHTDPISVIGFWFALEDADAGNGCLRVLPGGHRRGLKERFRELPSGDLVMDKVDPVDFDAADAVAVPVKAGTMIVLHGLLPHASAPNRSARSRLAYTLHVVDRAATWSADNWLKRAKAMPVRGFE